MQDFNKVSMSTNTVVRRIEDMSDKAGDIYLYSIAGSWR